MMAQIDGLTGSECEPVLAAKGRHLIVLEDDQSVSRIIEKVARNQGWDVRTAVTVGDFRAMIGKCNPDLVMLDLMFGKAHGVQEMRFLAQSGYTGAVALVSGLDLRVLASASSLGQSLGLRIVAMLHKPIRAARMREILIEVANQPDKTGHQPKPASADSAASRPPAFDFSEADISSALALGQMRLYLQPIHSSLDRSMRRFEGLIRWHHPSLGIVPPDQFIPIAERSEEVIDRLTMWVIEAAIGQYRRLEQMGRAIPISVNVSGVNLYALDFPDRVVALVDASGIPPSSLVFEVTESVVMRDPQTANDIITRLRLNGFGIAMDDFGIGYSSFMVLSQMPFSEIKIDKSFIARLISSRDSFAIVKSVIDLARNMGLECVAEGVETEEVAWMLGKLGATSLQGYLFHRPMPFEDVLQNV